ncbi:MAG: PQQ-dependent sugar dehydrogenase [Candidatus Contendobacter sp.]|nr:PQQ-dependent sugar dehydrogenase [Candidatus Contendobacter sp.]MDG4557412.1 PQQ-dependent sugar dehydrogenase [Candidatus Contendobacter sp.]
MALNRISSLLVAALLASGALSSVRAAESAFTSEEHAFRVAVVTRGLEHPWGLAFLPDGRLLVTERPGRLRLVAADGTLDPQPVAGLPPIAAQGQGGLLDVALHPQFAKNGLVYLSYAAQGEGGVGTEVARGRLVDRRLEDMKVLFRQHPKSKGGRHFGSRLVFDRQGNLYITMGDRGEMERAQNLDDLAGKIARLRDDGQIPVDNPFVNRAGARPEIYSLGNRNVQGAALHPATGELWAHEHGPQGGDEVNVIRAGRNYGWPVITYGVEYVIGTKIGEGTHKPGMEQPLHVWVPSIAPSGMAFYQGDRFPRWRGDLFVGALKGQMLVRLRFDGEKVVREERLLKDELGRIRDVRAGPDGYLYLLTDSSEGVIARLEPAAR